MPGQVKMPRMSKAAIMLQTSILLPWLSYSSSKHTRNTPSHKHKNKPRLGVQKGEGARMAPETIRHELKKIKKEKKKTWKGCCKKVLSNMRVKKKKKKQRMNKIK